MLKKVTFLSALILLYVASAASLSCVVGPDTYTFHCPEDEMCEKNLSLKEISLGYEGKDQISPFNKTKINKTNTSIQERFDLPYTVKKVENQELPSEEAAREADKGMCPSPANIHLYPIDSFEKKELQDRDSCYRTEIEEARNYYKVTREPTTEPPTCIRKHQDSMISGGDRSWVGPISWTDMIIDKIIDTIILNIIL